VDARKKTALVAVALNTVFTVLKFAIYGFSGSLAVLADAWHSLSDILTSLMVFFSLRARGGASEAPKPAAASGEGAAVFRFWRGLSPERRVAFVIGLFIAAAALGVVRKAAFSPAAAVSSPVLTGLFFLLFALGSFVVSRFEARMGRKHDSPGLLADSFHSRADMVGALITGLSMFLVRFGINADRPAALLISLLMLRCAFEILVHLRPARDGEVRAALPWKTWSEHRLFRGLAGRCRRLPPLPGPRRKAAAVVGGTAAVLFVLFRLCFYAVGPSQEAVRERWGRPLNWGRAIGPGLHFKLPWEKAVRVESSPIRSLAVGNVASAGSPAYLWTVDHGTEEPFISGDNNFFYPYVVVHYRVKDIFFYLYRHRRPEQALDDVATLMLTRIFAGREFYDIAVTARRDIEEEVRRESQKLLDAQETGLEIVSVGIRDIHPPIFIATSFETVIAAWQEKEMMINEALGYRNRSLPEARSREAGSLSEAAAYSARKQAASAGEGGGFLARQAAYRSSPEVIARRLLYQAAGEALAGRRLVLVDPAAGTPELWGRILPFADPDLGASSRPAAGVGKAARGDISEQEFFRRLRETL